MIILGSGGSDGSGLGSSSYSSLLGLWHGKYRTCPFKGNCTKSPLPKSRDLNIPTSMFIFDRINKLLKSTTRQDFSE